MKKIELVGLGNGIVDALVEAKDEFILEHNLVKSSMTLVDNDRQSQLLSAVQADYLKIACGGSVCNTIFTFASVGGTAGMLTSIGQDNFANFYLDQLNLHQISHDESVSQSTEPTGTSLIFISPDGERTMCTCLAASAEFSVNHLSNDLIASARYMLIEGYLLASDLGWEAVKKAIQIAKANDTKIVMTLSAEFIVAVFKERLDEIMPQVDLLFANDGEAGLYLGIAQASLCALKFAETISEVVITDGPNGSYYASGSELIHVPAISCQPVDLTGAGDSFAAGFMSGITKGLSPQKSLELGTYLAYRVITQVGARLDDLSIDELRNKSYL